MTDKHRSQRHNLEIRFLRFSAFNRPVNCSLRDAEQKSFRFKYMKNYDHHKRESLKKWSTIMALGCHFNYPSSDNLLLFFSGNFTSLGAIFHFKRDFGFYLLQEFIPTILVVALSWVSFWIDERSVPARVSLGITTVLAITTLIFGIQASMPRVGHVKAIDVFLLGSFLFVFAALVEYAIICTSLNVISSKEKRFQSRVGRSVITEDYSSGEIDLKENVTSPEVIETKHEEIQVKIFSLSPNVKMFQKWSNQIPELVK